MDVDWKGNIKISLHSRSNNFDEANKGFLSRGLHNFYRYCCYCTKLKIYNHIVRAFLGKLHLSKRLDISVIMDIIYSDMNIKKTIRGAKTPFRLLIIYNMNYWTT